MNMINILKRKHYISNFVLILIFILLAINVAQSVLKQVNKHRYIYVNMYDENGISNKCYYDTKTRDLRCFIPVKVKQYIEEK